MNEEYDFAKLILDLDEIDRWLQDLGLANSDRIRKYRRNIKRMMEAQESGAMSDLELTMPLEAAREILWSYIEADEFVRAISALRRYRCSEIEVILQSALKGVVDLFLESATTKQARDRLFELVMGGRIAGAGYQPYFDRGADVSFDFATMRVDIECKRPLTENGLEQVIRKGIHQLNHGSSELNIVAVSLSRIVVPGDSDAIPTVGSGETEAYLEQRLSQIIEPGKRFWENRPSSNLTGLWFYMFVPVRVISGSRYYVPARLERIVSTARGAHKDLQAMLVHALNRGERCQ